MTSLLAMQPSKYLRKEDINGEVQLQIANIKIEQVDENDPNSNKPVCYFHGHTKGLVLNKINSEILAHNFSDNIEAMLGQTVTLYVDPNVMMSGRLVGGLRIRASQAAVQPPGVSAPPQPGSKPIQSENPAQGLQTGNPDLRSQNMAPVSPEDDVPW